MPTPAKKPSGKGLAGAKIGGIPVIVIAGGVVAAIAVGLYIKHRSSTASTAAAASPASGTDPTGGAGSAGASSQDIATPIEDLAQSIYGLIPYLGGGGSPASSDGSSGSSGTSTTTQTTGSAVYVPPGYSLASSQDGVSYFTNPADPVVYQTSTGSPTGLAGYLPPAGKIDYGLGDPGSISGASPPSIPKPPVQAAVIPAVSPKPVITPTKPLAGKPVAA